MSITYNRIAGQNVERMAALSDGIFGVGMTLLVLNLAVPAAAEIHARGDLLRVLARELPQLVMYLMSFMTLGIFWVGQQTQLNHLERMDRHLAWINLMFLFAVTLMPFSTRLLGEFPSHRLALVVYWFNIACLGGALYLTWRYAIAHALVKPDLGEEVPAAICRRILFAQGLYALGALLCIVDTRLSIGFIVLIQLNYAVAPTFRRS